MTILPSCTHSVASGASATSSTASSSWRRLPSSPARCCASTSCWRPGRGVLAAADGGAPARPVPGGARVVAPVDGPGGVGRGRDLRASRDARNGSRARTTSTTASTTPSGRSCSSRPRPAGCAGPGRADRRPRGLGLGRARAGAGAGPRSAGEILGYTIGNDVSSRCIEGENPLYLPQAKIYTAPARSGPCLVPVGEAPDLAAALEITLTIASATAPCSRARRRSPTAPQPTRAGVLAVPRPGLPGGCGAADGYLDHSPGRVHPARGRRSDHRHDRPGRAPQRRGDRLTPADQEASSMTPPARAPGQRKLDALDRLPLTSISAPSESRPGAKPTSSRAGS